MYRLSLELSYICSPRETLSRHFFSGSDIVLKEVQMCVLRLHKWVQLFLTAQLRGHFGRTRLDGAISVVLKMLCAREHLPVLHVGQVI